MKFFARPSVIAWAAPTWLVVAYAWTAWNLKFRSYKHWKGWLQPSKADCFLEERRYQQIVGVLAHSRVLQRCNCLIAAVSVSSYLRWCGISSTLRFGAFKDQDGVKFHAWLESGGRPLFRYINGLSRLDFHRAKA